MNEYLRSRVEEWANSISHGIGVAAGIVFFPLVVLQAVEHGTVASVIGCVLFCVTMIVTYLSSALYHALPDGRGKDILLRLDHGSIFLLIAGTYAPFGLHRADFASLTYFTVIWTLAVVGLVLKLFKRLQNVWVSLVLYVVMGWLATSAVMPMFDGAAGMGKHWLIAGGVAYTTGILFFAFGERVRYFHLAWHCFVLAGTSLHAVAVFTYLMT